MRQERGKAPLMLMEQVVMILVFALAAALCMQAFVTASLLSGKSVQEDHGANISQSIAEVIKEEHGDLESAGKILKGIENGICTSGGKYIMIEDRKRAIGYAIRNRKPYSRSLRKQHRKELSL